MAISTWNTGRWVDIYKTGQLFNGENCNEDWPRRVGWTDWHCTLRDLVDFTQEIGFLLSYVMDKHLLEEFYLLFEHCVPFFGKDYFLVEFVPLNGDLDDCIRLRVDFTGWFYKYTIESEHTNKVVAYTQCRAARALEKTAKFIKEA